MKKNYFLRLTGSLLMISLLMISLLLTGCSIESSPQATVDNTEQLLSDTSESAEINAQEDICYLTYDKDYNGEDDQVLLSMTYIYPSLILPNQEQAATAINSYFEKELETVKTYSNDTLLPEAKQSLQQNPGDFSSFASYQQYELMRCDRHMVSFVSSNSYYLGDNNFDFYYQGVSFDGATGEVLTLTDIASDPDAFTESICNYILSQLERPCYEDYLLYSLDECADLIARKVLVEGGWYVSSAGVCIIIPTGLLTDSDLGILRYTVPYQQLNGLAVAYEYDGPFEMAGPLGTTLTADIDNNGDADAIYFDAMYNEDDGSVRTTLTVNGENYSQLLEDETYGLTDGATYGLDYYLIDLDTSDKYIELAIQDNGMSNDPITHFFRYKDFNLEYMGYISDLVSNSSFRWDGTGTFSCHLLLSLMLTTEVTATYEIKKDEIRLVEQDWYELDLSRIPQDMQFNAILEEFTAYTEADRHSQTVSLSPADGPVQFTGTDNEHWVSFVTPSGTTYYLYLTDFITLESGQYTFDVFDSLYLAG
ncbi:MAG: hypothetical protein ACI4DO_04185 [Roseburia sp.]